MLTLDVQDNKIILTSDNPIDRDVVKTINGAVAQGSTRWTLPLTYPTYIEAREVVLADGGELTPSAQAALQHYNEYIVPSALAAKTAEYPPVTLGNWTLKPTQEQCARFLAEVGSGAITSNMRTGKSGAVLRILDLKQAFPALIATMPGIATEIARQAEEVFPDKIITVLDRNMTATARKKALSKYSDIVICGHNLLALHAKLANYGGIKAEQRDREREKGCYEKKELDNHGFAAVVIDEGHAIENPKSQITRAAWGLGDYASTRIYVTGTSASNGDDNLWPALRFMFPKLFPARGKWLDRYVNMVVDYAGHPKLHPLDVVGNDGVKRLSGIRPNKRKEWNTIWDLISFRIEHSEGAPDIDYREIPVELSKPQMKAYKQMLDESMCKIGDEVIMATDGMSQRHRLDDLCDGTPKVAGGKVISLQLPSPKIDTLLDLLDDRKTIVVSPKRTTADLLLSVLADKHIPAVSILGGMTGAQQQAAQDEFNNGKARVIVINKAGAFGRELVAAKRTIFMRRDPDFRFSLQAENRNTSDDQVAEVVEVIDLYAKDTRDEEVFRAFAKKGELFHERMHDTDWEKRTLG